MNSLSVASEASKKYIFAANNLGSTVRAIIEDLYTHSHEHVTKEDIEDILKATDGQNSTGIFPWTAWSSRFIMQCKAKNETNSTIFAKMQKRGSDIPGEYWDKVVLEEQRFVENKLARGYDIHDDTALQGIIVKAHSRGYTLPEITRRIFENGSASAVNIDVVKRALESKGIPEAEHQNGKNFRGVVQKFVLSAYNLGMDVNNIRDQMYTHGFNLPDQILDLLRRNGIWQGENFDQARRSQAVQPMQPRARDNVRPGEGQVASRGAQAKEGLGEKIHVMGLLNEKDISPRCGLGGGEGM